MDALFSLSESQYMIFIYIWGALGVLSAWSIHFTKLLPISSKQDTHQLAFLGEIDKRKGWIIMETPVLISVIYCYWVSAETINVSIVFIIVFVTHYTNRALIYPHRIKVNGKTMPVSMMLMSMIFYIINGFLIGYYFGALQSYSIDWLYDPRFILGMAIFIFGFYVNITSDNILINLRAPGETGYKIPRGGFFKYVSCPNYFGEIMEWVGFAIMTWSVPGLVYCLWVALPVFAQAVQAHQWYLEHFGDEYPKRRKAVFPGLI